ncbi:hypothetical protein [Actibacterium sp. 188UL27-1]|uniref:hypothetical protein n=1 Tax=Actibacterium sp. 188UL27-1 TaxID=2786961 RepID=UPI00195BBD3E|nr:hypothetical protein [Actibacterium sp. 188UL27-1]MBM7066057.1 hypothetical protein [Actibacterium sp. 188UL27-1]
MTAFLGALFGAPFLGAVVSVPFAALLTGSIPVGFIIALYSVLGGGPLYLLFGIPVLIYALDRNWSNPVVLAALALATNLTMAAVYLLVAWLFGFDTDTSWSIALVIGGYGCLFAPLWGAMFGLIYTQIRFGFGLGQGRIAS